MSSLSASLNTGMKLLTDVSNDVAIKKTPGEGINRGFTPPEHTQYYRCLRVGLSNIISAEEVDNQGQFGAI